MLRKIESTFNLIYIFIYEQFRKIFSLLATSTKQTWMNLNDISFQYLIKLWIKHIDILTMHMSGSQNRMDQFRLFIRKIVKSYLHHGCSYHLLVEYQKYCQQIFQTHLFAYLFILSHSYATCIKFGPTWPHGKMLIFDKWRHLLYYLCNAHSVHLGFSIVTFFYGKIYRKNIENRWNELKSFALLTLPYNF